MSWDVNNLYLTGRLTKDPEIKETQNGKTFLKISIASNFGMTIEKKERTEYYTCMVFGELAEFYKDKLKKGRKVFVKGKIKQVIQEDKKTYLEIIAEYIVRGDEPFHQEFE